MILDPFYSSPRAQFGDSNLNPLSNGRISFYYPNSTTLKQIYADISGEVPAPNPHSLDAGGWVQEGGIRLGTGNYKVVLEASDGSGGFTEVWTMDNVTSSNSGSSGLGVSYINIIDDLRGLTDGSIPIAYCMGYYASRDGGGGLFVWDANSTADDDGGSVIAPNGTPAQGRWLRSFGDEVTAWQFGAMSTAPSVVDGNLVKMMAYANGSGRKKVEIQSDDYNVSSLFFLSGSEVFLEIQEGAKFIGSGSVTIDCNSLKVHGQKALIDENVGLTINPSNPIDCYADWWGVDFAVKSSGNYPSRLKFNGSYTLAPSANSSHESWLFEEGAVITISNTSYKTTIKEYIADENWNNIWSGSQDDLIVNDQSVFPVNHFTNVLSDAIGYGVFLNLASLNGARKPLVTWGGYNMYVNVPTYDRPNDIFIESEVLKGSIWSFGSSCWVGQIVNTPYDYIIDSSLVEYPIADNGVVYAQWFGANTSNPLNASLLDLASSWSHGFVPVDGAGASFFIKESYSFYKADQSLGYNFQNMTLLLEADADFAETFTIRNSTKMKNFNIASSNFLDVNIGVSSDILGGIQRIITGENCNFEIVSNFNTYGVLTYKNTNFKVDNFFGCYVGVYDFCTFSRIDGQISTSNLFNMWQYAILLLPAKITNCTFLHSLNITANNSVLIKDSNVSYDGNVSGINLMRYLDTGVHQAIIIENNILTKVTTALSIGAIGAFNEGGNVNCSVKNNVINGAKYTGTHRLMKKDVAITGIEVEIEFPNDWVILPYQSYVDPSFYRPLPYKADANVLPTDPLGTYPLVDQSVCSSIYPSDDSSAFKTLFLKIENDSNPQSSFVTLDISVNDLDSIHSLVV